jgi:hypothetical protein
MQQGSEEAEIEEQIPIEPIEAIRHDGFDPETFCPCRIPTIWN